MNRSLHFILIGFLFFTACKMTRPAFSLLLPEHEIEVVQQISEHSDLRLKSPLYLPPYPIKKKFFGSELLSTLIDSMYAVMLRTSGVGISANQIGKRLQLFIIEAKIDNPRYKVLGGVPKQIFINPRITRVSANRKNFWHACLSAKGKDRGNVATFEWIEFECRNQNGDLVNGRLDGFAAVIFQHEFKHLMTGTYLDVAHQFLSKADLDQQIAKGNIPFFEDCTDAIPLLIEGYCIGETLDQYHSRKK